MCPQETNHHWMLFLDPSTVLVTPDSMHPSSSRLLQSTCHMNKIISYISKSFTEDQISNCAVERPWGKSLYSDSATLSPHPRRTGFLFLCMCLHVRVCICLMSAGAWGCQKRASDTLELQLQAFGSFPKWMLGAKLRSFGIAWTALNHQACLQALWKAF